MSKKQLFEQTLAAEYETLFATDSDYAYSASKVSAKDLAAKMTHALLMGSGNKDGKGIQRTCKKLGINHSYKAIGKYLAE